MSDIFNEIDEELRNEQIRKLWDRYGVLVLAAAVAVVVAVAGWRLYDYWRLQQARAQGDAFAAAEQLARSGAAKEAEEAFAGLSATGSGGYVTLAALRAAGARAETGDAAGALRAFDAVAARSDTSPLLADVARVRAAYLALDLEDRAGVEKRAEPLAVPGRPFRHSAREILALAAWKADDFAAARRWIDAIEADPETPRGLADRAAVLAALLQASTVNGKVN